MSPAQALAEAADRRLLRADRIFSNALELDAPRRATYLERACGPDTELRRLVDALLEAAFETDEQLRSREALRGVADPAAETVSETVPDGSPAMVGGRYRVLRELGRGGMGVVYLAERADGQFEQQVALKVIHQGAGPRAAARFLRERQILAALAHPKIARLLDGGVGPRGQPYLVMEHVEGQPIDRYCAEKGLGWRRRLALLVDVCAAVQAAHRQLVVHRDLKPSNILVDTSGEVKLLDFGIAKLLEDTGDGLGVTGTGGQVMTPQYASPEQYQGGVITVASDVYQLGLVAYELLCGRRPFELADVPPVEAVRRVCVLDPAPPSAAATTTEARRRLQGDLDAIILQALHKDPERRYRSADQLREDLLRHLTNRPVLARPDSLRYRLTKFVERHRWPVVLTAAFLTLLVVAGVMFATRLAEERDRTWQQAQMAQEQQRHAEEVATFLVGLFEGSSPLNDAGEPQTVRQVLDRGATRVQEELTDQPATQARLLHTIGRIDHVLGNYDRARELLQTSLALRQEVEPENPEEIVETLETLAQVTMELGDVEASCRSFERALRVWRRQIPQPPQVGRTLHRLAACRQHQGRWSEAVDLGREALATSREANLPTVDVVRALDGLANSLDEMGEVGEARRLYREVLDLDPSELGAWHPARAITSSNLAATYAREGDFAAAVPLFELALEVAEHAFGREHPHWVIMASNLATSHRELGRFDDAEAIYREALAWRRQFYGEQHLEVGRSLVDLGNLELDRGRPDAAETLFRESLGLQLALDEPVHPFTGQTWGFLGNALEHQGQDAAAEAAFLESLAILRQVHGPEHLLVSEPMYQLAELRRRAGDLRAAQELLQQVLTIRRGAEGLRPSLLHGPEEALRAVSAALAEPASTE